MSDTDRHSQSQPAGAFPAGALRCVAARSGEGAA